MIMIVRTWIFEVALCHYYLLTLYLHRILCIHNFQ